MVYTGINKLHKFIRIQEDELPIFSLQRGL